MSFIVATTSRIDVRCCRSARRPPAADADDVCCARRRSDFASAGIIGALIFIVTLGVGPLARNLRESEERVRQREVDVANLAELNQYIVQHLRESILVVDANDTIRLINESAAMLLQGASTSRERRWRSLAASADLLDTWRRRADDWQLSTLTMLASDGGSLVQPHFVSLDSSGKGPTLVFLEDTTLIAERVQQSKLAALGRLSASIAHEIRNPVGAMSHAGQLLAESPALSPQERRLTDIITKNGERVSTIINNVLQLSRRDQTRPERIELNAWLGGFPGGVQPDLRGRRARNPHARRGPATSTCASIRRTCISCCGTCARTR